MSLVLDAVIHGFFVDGVLRGVAELRLLGTSLPEEAEAAFSIERPWQSHGVGTALLQRTLLAARNRGIKLMHMACLASNRRIIDLAHKFEAELRFDFGSAIGEVEAPHPTPISVLRERVAGGRGFATALLDVQARMLRPAWQRVPSGGRVAHRFDIVPIRVEHERAVIARVVMRP